MNRSRFEILIPFSRSVALSKILHFLFITTSDSYFSISIALCCAFAITYTSMVYYTSTSTTFSSPTSFCTTCVSTKCCSTTLSSSDFSMNIGSTNVALGLVCYLAHQLFLLCKNSTTNVLSWIIIYANCIFSIIRLSLCTFQRWRWMW